MCKSLIILLCCSLLVNLSISKIIGSFIFPHGGIALDPTYFNTTDPLAKEQAWKLHHSAKEIGEQIAQLSPDVVFLVTPHGVADLTMFEFYLGNVATGYADDLDTCKCPPCCYNVTVHFDEDLTAELLRHLKVEHNVSAVSAFSDSEPFPLRWAEVIPFYFTGKSTWASALAVVLSIPYRRFADATSMMNELSSLGTSLFEKLEAEHKRITVIISGDLAHTHDPNGPYGFSPAAKPFDEACGRWVETQTTSELTVTAASCVDEALSCGFPGFVLLDALLHSHGACWHSKLYANYHPSYYGMMVASFLPCHSFSVRTNKVVQFV